MAAPGPILPFYSVGLDMMDGTIDLDLDTIKCVLLASAYTPNRSTHTVYAHLTNELSTANGYTSGGATMASPTTTRASAVTTFDAADVPTWTASGGSLVARYAALYANVTRNGKVNPLLAYFLLDSAPADVTTADGNSLQIVWNAAGIFAVTVT